MLILRLLLSLLAGASATAALAPFNIVWLAPVAPLLFYLILSTAPQRNSWLLGWSFGLGFFGTGVSWVFVSIYEHSATPLPLAVALTALFVSALALLFMLQGGCWKRWFSGRWGALSFIGLWILGEWLRSWLLTGFPWLYLGYATLDTPLASWAPMGGVWLNSLIVAGSGIVLFEVLREKSWPTRASYLLILIAPWALLPFVNTTWTTASGTPLNLTLIQADIDQEDKWDPQQRDSILARYEALSLPRSGDDLIIWPETAIPTFFSRAAEQLSPMLEQFDADNTTLISGLPTSSRDPDSQRRLYHNSIAVLSNGSGVYHKERLVPFGEYIPMEHYLRGALEFFNLPMSSFSLPLSDKQSLLNVQGHLMSAAICYEIAYPELVRESSQQAAFILTVSNDTWFGHSIAPDQHMQIARMRALESQRWIIRSTNNGISGLIDPHGNVTQQAPRYTQAILTGSVQPRQGLTPFQQVGSWPVVAFSFLLCIVGLGRQKLSFNDNARSLRPNLRH